MIRPSALALAERCPESAYLAAEHPHASEATDAGNEVDGQITALVNEGKEPTHPAAIACVEWLREKFSDGAISAQRPLTLFDIDAFDGRTILTSGTCDVLHVDLDKRLVSIVDWKKSGQLHQGRVQRPDENLQMLAYLAAAMAEHDMDGQAHLVFFDDSSVVERWSSRVILGQETWPIIDRVLEVQRRTREAVTGPHCQMCYVRDHCRAHVLPVSSRETPVALAPLAHDGKGLTTEADALGVLEWVAQAEAAVSAAEDLISNVREQVESFALRHGGVRDGKGKIWRAIQTEGKRSGASVKELEAAGLHNMIKRGRPGTKFTWVKEEKEK